MVKPGGILVFDGFDIYKGVTLAPVIGKTPIPGKDHLSEVSVLNGLLIEKETLVKGESWPDIGYRLDSPLEAIVNITYCYQDNGILDKSKTDIKLTEWENARARDFRSFLSIDFGIPKESIHSGTVSELDAVGINIRSILDPLGVNPIPRWDGQVFFHIVKPE